MNGPKRKVASSLGATGFDPEQYARTTVAATQKNRQQGADSATPKALTESVSANSDSAQSQAVKAIPRTITAGQQPYKRSGKRRVGVTRKYNNDVVKTTIVLPTAVHDKLQEIMFRNRKTTRDSLNDLVMQGLDHLFADYGIEPIDTLVAQSETDLT